MPPLHPHLVSGPQGPRVVLDGRPVLLLCSGNALGLADHPRVREAAADAAMRWGVGAGSSRHVAGSMTVHRRLEERLAEFHATEAAVLFGAGYLAGMGVVSALAGPGDHVLCDELSQQSVADGARLSGAKAVGFRHADAEHLAWTLERLDVRGGLVVTDAVFATDGDVAPLAELAAVARRYDLRFVVDETHGTGTLGPGGRGAVADAGLEDEVDVVVGSLSTALGAYGGFAATDRETARFLAGHARTIAASCAPAPPVAAAALAALELLVEQPRRVDKLQANGRILRDALAREGFDVTGSTTHIVPVVVGDDATTVQMADAALELGVFVQPVRPPDVPEGTARLRLTVMSSHAKAELRDAARALGRAALRAGFRPDTGLPVVAAHQATDEWQALPAVQAA